MTRALNVEEIGELMMSFAMAAAMAKVAGVDAIEIQGLRRLPDRQFNRACGNTRTDAYGGDLDGRMRFPMELISATRSMVGPDFPIIYKFTPDHYIPGGRRLDEGLEMARRLEQAASMRCTSMAAATKCGTASSEQYEQPACQIPLAAAVKHVREDPRDRPRQARRSGRRQTGRRDEKADFVAIGRPLLADRSGEER